MTVYLLHFDRSLARARHYLGFAEDLEARLERHRRGDGARLMEVIAAEGIGFTLARRLRRGGRPLAGEETQEATRFRQAVSQLRWQTGKARSERRRFTAIKHYRFVPEIPEDHAPGHVPAAFSIGEA